MSGDIPLMDVVFNKRVFIQILHTHTQKRFASLLSKTYMRLRVPHTPPASLAVSAPVICNVCWLPAFF